MNILKCSRFIIIESDNFKFTLIPGFNSTSNTYFIRANVMSFSTKTDLNDKTRGKHTFPLFSYELNPKDLNKNKRRSIESLIETYEPEFYDKAIAYLESYESKINKLKEEISKRKVVLADEEAEQFFDSL